VWYAIACHAITVTNFCFTWYSVVINVILILVSALSFVTWANFILKYPFKLSFWITWGELYETCQYRTDFSFELWIIKVFEITSTFVRFFSSWRKLKLKFEISQNFDLLRFKLTRFYCRFSATVWWSAFLVLEDCSSYLTLGDQLSWLRCPWFFSLSRHIVLP
jgi:hypothetical protein